MQDFLIEKACKKDAKELLALLSQAYLKAFTTLTKASCMEQAINKLCPFYCKDKGRFSHQNILVLKQDQKIKAAVCIWDASLEKAYNDELERAFQTSIKPQALAGFLYLDAIAASEKNQGHGTKLIKYILAKKRGGNKLASRG